MISVDPQNWTLVEEVFTARRRQGLVRIVFALAFFLGYGGYVGWLKATLWLGAYYGLQAFEYALQRFERRAPIWLILVLLAANSAVFGALAMFTPRDEHGLGIALAVMMLVGGLLNVVLTSQRSLIVFLFNGAPFAIYLQMLAVKAFLSHTAPYETCILALASTLITIYLWLLWKQSALSLTETITALARAESADAAKSVFLANVSHELRTPLNGIVGMVSVLERSSLTREQVDMLNVVRVSANNLNVLLSDVLDMSKIEAGQIELEIKPMAPRDIVDHVGALFRASSMQKDIVFELEVGAGSADAVLADPTRLTQILTNLCSNAVKFTEKGSVKLSVQTELRGDLRQVTFRVTDTGIGMTAQAQARLFKRFSQADDSISRRFGGTGLGLSICLSLTELMGGEIGVESQEGVGSTFTASFAFRTVEASASPASLPETAVAFALGGPERLPRLLLAEDHPVNRKIVQLMLEGVAELTMVVDGAEAVASAASNDYDVILMDMHMPVLDGVSATRAIRLAEWADGRCAVPIVMLTGEASADHMALSHKAGANGHLVKPVTAARLLEAIELQLAEPKAAPPPLERRSERFAHPA